MSHDRGSRLPKVVHRLPVIDIETGNFRKGGIEIFSTGREGVLEHRGTVFGLAQGRIDHRALESTTGSTGAVKCREVCHGEFRKLPPYPGLAVRKTTTRGLEVFDQQCKESITGIEPGAVDLGNPHGDL